MSYEEKYKEALKRADSLTEKYGGREFAEYVFPELAESEDERMVRAIEHILYENYSDAAIIEGIEIAEIVAWLEKQKEQKPAEWSEDSVKFEEGFKAGRESGLLDGQKYVLNNLDSYGLCKPAEWSKDDKTVFKNLRRLISFCFAENFVDAQTAHDMREWLKTRLKSLRPQK